MLAPSVCARKEEIGWRARNGTAPSTKTRDAEIVYLIHSSSDLTTECAKTIKIKNATQIYAHSQRTLLKAAVKRAGRAEGVRDTILPLHMQRTCLPLIPCKGSNSGRGSDGVHNICADKNRGRGGRDAKKKKEISGCDAQAVPEWHLSSSTRANLHATPKGGGCIRRRNAAARHANALLQRTESAHHAVLEAAATKRNKRGGKIKMWRKRKK